MYSVTHPPYSHTVLLTFLPSWFYYLFFQGPPLSKEDECFLPCDEDRYCDPVVGMCLLCSTVCYPGNQAEIGDCNRFCPNFSPSHTESPGMLSSRSPTPKSHASIVHTEESVGYWEIVHSLEKTLAFIAMWVVLICTIAAIIFTGCCVRYCPRQLEFSRTSRRFTQYFIRHSSENLRRLDELQGLP